MGGDDYPHLDLLAAFEAKRDGCNIDAPEFENAGVVHDWRNYVPDVLRSLWWTLKPETRIAVFLTAQERAVAEEWE